MLQWYIDISQYNCPTMLDYHYISTKERLFLSTVGIPLKRFHKLAWRFSQRCKSFRFNRPQIRSAGGGRKPERFGSDEELLFYLLFYVRIYPTFDLAQAVFELDRANLCRWLHTYLPVLERTLLYKIALPAKQTNTLAELFKKVPALAEHIVDATEQRMNRPKYNQEPYYSGKKKCHTRKRQIICTGKGKLLGVSSAVPGSVHDKRLEEQTMYLNHAPPGAKRLGDRAYQGESDTYGIWGIRTMVPKKKPKGGELTSAEKEVNRQISSLRVIVEHVIGHLKYSRIFGDKTRYRRDISDPISNVVGGLYNFKHGY